MSKKKMRTGPEYIDPPPKEDSILAMIAKERTGREDINPAAQTTMLRRAFRGAGGKTAKKRWKEAIKPPVTPATKDSAPNPVDQARQNINNLYGVKKK